MSDQDDAEKTEEPSARKLQQARSKGQVLSSREVNNFAVLLGGAIVFGIVAPFTAMNIVRSVTAFIERPEAIDLSGGGADTLMETLFGVAFAVAPAIGVLLVLAVLGAFMQTGWLLAPESLQPKFERISPMAGLKRLFSLKSIIELVKGVLKMAVVGIVAYIAIAPELDRMEIMVQMDPLELLGETHWVIIRMFIGVLIVMAVIAVADYAYQRYEFMSQMRMTKQEVRDEHKQTEGDPHIKGRLRQLRMQRARARMMAAVPSATVVVTNPTHYAVALKYEMEKMTAPRVVAKGVDAVALRIREVAKENEVPIVENRPLARALYDGVELDQEIPEEHYKAVAEVISYVYKLRKTHIPVRGPL